MVILYLTIIALSNIVTAAFAPLTLFGGMLIIPAGSVFVGVTFVLRDLVQLQRGRRFVYRAILAASAISAVVSLLCGDTPYVALASVAAFTASETIDTEIFARLKKSIGARVTLSGIIGGIADSIIFVILGLSPIGANVLGWDQVLTAILGQTITKVVVQPLGAIWFYRKQSN